MKKTLALLLAILFAAGLCGRPRALAAATDPETREEKLDPAAVEAQAFALSMACDEARSADGAVDLAAEAAGWYAAWLWRTREIDLVDEGIIRDFLDSLQCRDKDLYPSAWEEHGLVRRLRRDDGGYSLDYADHKGRLESTLGVTTEFDLQPFTFEAVTFTVIRHLVGEQTVEREYTVAFEPNPDTDSRFPWQLISITVPAPGPSMDPALTFDWDMLTECNRLSNLLALYPGIRVQNAYNAPEMADWILLCDGETADLTFIGGELVSGAFRGCFFTVDPSSGRAVVSSLEPASSGMNKRTLADRLGSVERMTLEKIDGELIYASCLTAYGILEHIAVDRGTLALREHSLDLEDGENLTSETFIYDETPPDASLLDGWEAPLRTVTVHWESFENGEHSVETSVVRLPANWEYLPGEAQWGDYHCWMDEGYTRPYVYPGDGVDYDLYLTTALG